MKKPSVVLIVVWSVLFGLGILSFVIGAAVSMQPWLRWCIALVLWLSDCTWIAIALLLKRPKKSKTGGVFVGNQAVYQRISRETNEAVSRYLGAVMRKGLMKKSALYERPWFLLCGAPKSGKTALLRGAGLNFPMRYPSEKDGVQIEGADQITWYFANEAVWIDIPGSVMQDENKDVWQAFLASLQQVRPDRPVDGMAMVVSAHEVHSADDRAVKDGARMLRNRVDDLIAAWGIEFPVSLLFNQSDRIPGFSDYFGDQFVKAQDQIFGATLGLDQGKMLPRMAFAQEFGLLSKSLTDLRLDKLFKEKDPARRRMICRFVIHFEAMQEKLGAFVTELFKPSNYEGKPLFRGFYFTSCMEIASRDDGQTQSKPSAEVGQTIANHPLNPRKMLAQLAEVQSQKSGGKKSEVTSLFVLPLFREIMVRDKSLVTTTQKRSRRETARHYILTAAILCASLGIAGFLAAGLGSSLSLFSDIKSRLAGAPSEQNALLDQYAGLDVIGKTVSRLQQNEDHGAPLTAGLSGYYRGREVLSELQKQYFAKIQSLVVGPSVKYLEYVIWEKVQGYGDLAGEDYDNLYNFLKAYLSISEAMSSHSKDIDTTFLRGMLLDAIKQSLLSAMGNDSRLPVQLETILQENVGVYLLYIKRQAFPTIQENQRLVSLARTKLRRLPSAENLYQSIVNRLSQDAPSISLDQMLNRQQEGILKSERKISALYTQDGWDKYMSEGISQASKDPFKLDWVIGLSEGDVPEAALDKKKLYADMVAAYMADFKQQWLGFISSVKMDPFGDLARSQRILQKLVADGSELAVLLQTVSTYTILKQESVADKAGGAILEAASKMKATKGLAKNLSKADSAADKAAGAFSLGQKSPADDLNSTFDPLRVFTRSTGGALSGYEGYKDKIMTLSGKLAALQTQGEDYALVVFSGRDDDALLNAWKYTQSALTAMPEDLAGALKGVLLSPLTHTGAAASAVLTKTLNGRWHAEIVKPFTSRFSGRYPFVGRGEDASFTDVMDFFRPQTGTLWGFYDRVLSPFIVKNTSGWMVRSVGSLTISFNPAVAKALTSGERIRDIFFKPDGTLRTLATTITPSGSNKNSAKIEVNGQVSELTPGGKSVNVNWPIDATPLGASLKINVSSDFTQDISFAGAWGFLKLLQAARINKVSSSVINAKWQVNVQNMYMVYQDYRIQVAGTDHPFGDPVFSEFDCPTDLCIAEEKK
jgi:type VI secretion system protein ImpL